ncbi:MAG: tol-pal system-associated acyl-CoA thioesterase [Gammaproteobacteria bacterium]|nr:MAG: tol-pal system-associated acyl-CoA thioesterase [Gammaproteobacteria bacterium]
MSKIFNWPVRVYYEDTDVGGVVFYANYLKFYERARTEMLRDMGFEQDELIAQESVIFAVRSVQLDYLKPARFNELLNISAQLSSVKSASITFAQSVTRNNELLNTAMIRIACLDSGTLRPRLIPEVIKQAFNHE